METLLTRQPFLLGDRFTLADASAYGQLSMNLVDGEPAERLREHAPVTFDWLCAIRDRGHCGGEGDLYLSEALQPLLRLIGETFVPLMQQNEAAYERCVANGETLFNEAAFDRGHSLFDGELRGHRFRTVVKSFQVRIWRDLRHTWAALPEKTVAELESVLPPACCFQSEDCSG